MELKYIGNYEYSKTKKFKMYEDEFGEKYLEKETNLKNYEILRKISEISKDNINLSPIIEFKKKEEQLIYYIKLYKGYTFEQIARTKTKFRHKQINEIIYQISNGLKSLHQNDIIHRDIKPANIMIVEGVIKLIDYDISRIYNAEKELDTEFMGTRMYAAPEQFGYNQTSNKSDIYSLGKTIESILKYNFDEERFVYDNLINRCLDVNPDNRFVNIEEIIKFIESINKELFKQQLKQIQEARNKGVTEENIKKFAKIELNAKQMGVFKHSFIEKINKDVINLMLMENYSSRQLYQIKQGDKDDLTLDQIKEYAKIYLTPEEMSIYRTGVKFSLSKKEIYDNIKNYNIILNCYELSSEQLNKVRFAVYNNVKVSIILAILEKMETTKLEDEIDLLINKGEV